MTRPRPFHETIGPAVLRLLPSLQKASTRDEAGAGVVELLQLLVETTVPHGTVRPIAESLRDVVGALERAELSEHADQARSRLEIFCARESTAPTPTDPLDEELAAGCERTPPAEPGVVTSRAADDHPTQPGRRGWRTRPAIPGGDS